MSNGKIIIGVAIVAAAIGGPFYVHNQVMKKASGFSQSVDKMAQALPENMKQEHTQKPGFFETTGEYKLFFKRADGFEQLGNVTYKMEHGLMQVFSSKYPLDVKLNLNWNMLPFLTVAEQTKPYYTFVGAYDTNGSFNLDGVAQDLDINLQESETKMHISGNTMSVVYDKIAGETTIKNNVKKIENKEAGDEFTNYAMIYKYTLPEGANLGAFNIDFTLENAKQGYANFNGLKFNFSGGEKSGKVDTSVELKADSITSVLAGDKKFTFDMQMSMKELDADFYRQLSNITDLDNVSPKQAQALLIALKKMIDDGFIISVDRLNITEPEDELKSQFVLHIEKKSNEEQNFINRGVFNSKIYLKSPFVSSAINIIPMELRGLMVGKVNEVTADFRYEKGDVSLNGKPLPPEYAEFINEFLLTLEESLNMSIEEMLEELKNSNSVDLKETEVAVSNVV